MNENKYKEMQDKEGREESSRGKGKSKKRNGRRSNNLSSNCNRAGGSRTSGKDRNVDLKSKTNSPDWYLKNPELTQTATGFNLLYPTGVPFKMLNTANILSGADTVKMNDTNLPGVCAFRYIPTIGYASNASDPVNVATTKLYAYVRHMNSGHTNYESADLMLYILQMRQCYSWYMWMARLYGILNSHSPLNRFLPKTIVASMGVDYDDLIANMPKFLFHINSYAAKLNALSIPNNMKLFDRAAWMNAGIYFDSDITKAQVYLFTPYSYTIYDPASAQTGGKLAQVQLKMSGIKYEDIALISNSILDPVYTDEDMNIMSGDILKAYQGNCLQVTPIDTTYTSYPVYIPEVLDQIHNARILGVEPTGDELQTWAITQANGVLRSLPKVTSTEAADVHLLNITLKNLMDFPDNSISEGRTLESSRFMFTGQFSFTEAGLPTVSLTSFGTEVIVAAMIYNNVNGKPTQDSKVYSTFADSVDPVSSVRAFERAPIMFRAASLGNKKFLITATPEGEIGNYLTVDNDVLYMLHQTALMSILDL